MHKNKNINKLWRGNFLTWLSDSPLSAKWKRDIRRHNMLVFLQMARPPKKWPFLHIQCNRQLLSLLCSKPSAEGADGAPGLLAAVVHHRPAAWNRHKPACCRSLWCFCSTVLVKVLQVRASVEELATLLCAAVARQLVAGVLDGELVVIGELFPAVDAARGEDDDVLLAIHGDHPGVAVGLAGVVDEAGSVAVHRGIHHLIVIDAKHVAANALWGERGQFV